MKITIYSLLFLALGITFVTGMQKGLTLLGLFATSPYVGALLLLYLAKQKTAIITAEVLAVFLVSVGLYFLLDTTYMERNLGIKFSFLFIPLWQWTMLLVAGLVVLLSNGRPKIS